MAMWMAVVVVVVVVCTVWWWWRSTRRLPGLPPGPGPALPLLGHLHLLPRDPRPQLWAWRRRYGDVVSLYLGGQLTVVLTSYSAIREALVTFADVFSDRPHDFNMDEVIGTKGVIASSGPAWKEQRRMCLDILRQLGMGRNVMAERIQEEITHYIRAIRHHQGAPVDLAQATHVSVSNNICSILLGKRFDYDDPQFLGYLRCVDENLTLMTGTAILVYLPFLGYLPGDLFKKRKVLANVETVYSFIRQHLAEHRTALLEQGEVEEKNTDFIFSYLHRIHDGQARRDDDSALNEEGLHDSALNEEGLQNTVADLFIAGSEATHTAVLWALLFLLHHPHVQDRCFRDISDVIGPHRRPSVRDKVELPYVEATVLEVLRRGDVAPVIAPRTTVRHVAFRGHVIPRDTMILPFMSGVLQDPDIWGDPDNFRPERFLSPDGKVRQPEEFIPFGVGRRACPGESLVRMELFLYLTTLIQHFRFLPAEGEQPPSLEGVFGQTCTPQPYKVRAVPRL